MIRILFLTITVILSTACSWIDHTNPRPLLNNISYSEYRRFSDERELQAYLSNLNRLRGNLDLLRSEYRTKICEEENLCVEEIMVTASKRTSNPSITNNQEHGVDEGDIIKVIGDYFVVLRKGKLYSIAYQQSSSTELRYTDSIDVFKPGWPHEAWYDEMLVKGNTLVVIGYTYENDIADGVSELNILNLDEQGHFTHQNTYFLKSSDYYDMDNYASRIIDDRIVISVQLPLSSIWGESTSIKKFYPALARLENASSKRLNWKPLLQANQIQVPEHILLYPSVHTLIDCKLGALLSDCRSSAFIGGQTSRLYVTHEAAYIWHSGLNREGILYLFDNPKYYQVDQNTPYYDTFIHRMDLTNSTIGSVRVTGAPINQFSFTLRDHSLHVFLGEELNDEQSKLRLYDIPLDAFIDKTGSIGLQDIEIPEKMEWSIARFAGDWLVLGESSKWWEKQKIQSQSLYFYALNDGLLREVSTQHTADRLELIDDNLLSLGYNSTNQVVSSLLNLDNLSIYSQLTLTDFSLTESRSHAFNYHQTITGLGLAGFAARLQTPERENTQTAHTTLDDTSDVAFIGIDKSLNQLISGSILSDRSRSSTEEDCNYSCTDWYGNTRAFFVGERIFALLGDDIVEAKLSGVRLFETQRESILPRPLDIDFKVNTNLSESIE